MAQSYIYDLCCISLTTQNLEKFNHVSGLSEATDEER